MTHEIISTTEAKVYVKKPRMGKMTLPFFQPSLVQGTSGTPPKRRRVDTSVRDEFSSETGENPLPYHTIPGILFLKKIMDKRRLPNVIKHLV